MRRVFAVAVCSCGVAVLTIGLLLSLFRQQPIDGAWILFISGRTGHDEIWRMWQDGSYARQLTQDGNNKQQLAVSPDGQKIAYGAFVDESREIIIADANARHPYQLTDNIAMDSQPTWSPDGRGIMFFSDRDGTMGLYQMPLSAGTQIREGWLTTSPTAIGDGEWSPDGKWVVFQKFVDGVFNLFIASADGGAIYRLTHGLQTDAYGTWSSDGQSLVFVSLRESSQSQIYRMDVSDDCIMAGNCEQLSPPRRLTTLNPNTTNFAPQWQDDWIAFSVWQPSDDNQIYLMRSDGSDMHPITTSGKDYSPVWQPFRELAWHPAGLLGLGTMGFVAGLFLQKRVF